jgi:hypothetical protein
LTPAKPKAIKAKAVKPSNKATKPSDKAAKPSKTTKQKVQPAKSDPKTPAAPVSIFAARQIEASRNKQSATLLFTPHKQRGTQIRFAYEQQPSPTRHHASQNLPSQLGSSDGDSDGDSDVEEELVEGLQHLDFHAGSDSDSHSGAQSPSGSVSSSHSRSHARQPRAGPHSKPSQPRPRPAPKGGAQDVWSFFTKVKGRHECVLCQ